MKINRIKIFALLTIVCLVFHSCEVTDLDKQESPNQVTPDNADPDQLLGSVQLYLISSMTSNGNSPGFQKRAAEFSRIEQLFGPYTGVFALTPSSLNIPYNTVYANSLQDLQVYLDLAQERELEGYVAVGKILKAYTAVTLVDLFGKIPYSEALKPTETLNPNVDEGQAVYEDAYKLLDEAITALESDPVMPEADLFYDGNSQAWVRFANSFKLRMLVQTRLVDDVTSEINSIIADGNLIVNPSQDFQFEFSSVVQPADSRHYYYQTEYDVDGADDYITSYFVFKIKEDKAVDDPRLRYYFYRQTEEDPTGDNLPCEGLEGFNFCYLGDGYWTRDHGDESGVPADNLLRTTYGIYPIGGAFDDDSFLPVTENSGLGGAGIYPMLLSSWVKFLEAEAALTLGTTGDPKVLLEEALRDALQKVINFAEVNSEYAATQEDVEEYVSYVLEQYESAESETEKLNIIMTEYYLASYGNGIEAYNIIRRTGMPLDLSDPVISAGQFPNTYLYPADLVNLNNNVDQKPVTEKVFWDTGSHNLN